MRVEMASYIIRAKQLVEFLPAVWLSDAEELSFVGLVPEGDVALVVGDRYLHVVRIEAELGQGDEHCCKARKSASELR
jgi:hypothetical protein